MQEHEGSGAPRCGASDVDPDWWTDPDAYPEDFPHGKIAKGTYSLETEYGRLQQRVREDQLRAQILCYDCPLLFACRARSWDEPAHVWGGLTATERWQARRDGYVRPYGTYRSSQNELLRRKIEVAFLDHCSIDAIAATLNLTRTTVMYQIRGILLQRRARAEREAKCLPTPPRLSQESPQTIPYQDGLGSSSSTSLERSA